MTEKKILLGDEALAWGAIHSGISAVYGYPGTPSTEIFETLQKEAQAQNIHALWSTNEKVAYEEALGMSYSGKRSLVTMKHVGLNVAADPFMNSAITGVHGGLVLAVADDPGMHSSQNEQDSRVFGQFALIPIFEPSSQQEAYEMVLGAFEFSEEFKIPVMIRLVTRLSHSRGNVELNQKKLSQKPFSPLKDFRKWTLLPSNARGNYERLTQQQEVFVKKSEESPHNVLHLVPKGKKGILSSGIATNYVFENIGSSPKDFSFLTLKQYPLPWKKIHKFISSLEEVWVVEEGYPWIEQMLFSTLPLLGKKVYGKLSGHLPRTGELDPDCVRKALGMSSSMTSVVSSPLVQRPPQLCKGCPHGSTFEALKEAMKDFPEGNVFGDIGCYTLAAGPPYSAIQSCVDMGASISMAIGASHAGLKPSVAAIGDSTFGHSGMTPLLDAVNQNTPITVIILDNSTVAMTGGQKTSSSGNRLFEIVKGLGVLEEHIRLMEPLPKNHGDNVKLLKEELGYEGVSVVISQRECLETLKKQKRVKSS